MNFEQIDILTIEEIERNYEAIIELKNHDIPLISQAVSYCYCKTCTDSWSCGPEGPASSSTYWQCYCSTYDYKTFIYSGHGACPTPSC